MMYFEFYQLYIDLFQQYLLYFTVEATAGVIPPPADIAPGRGAP